MLLIFYNSLYNNDLFNLYYFIWQSYSKIFGGKKVRVVVEPQMKLGADIAAIEFDLRSRDEIPKLLIGLQHIYKTPEIREKVFEILNEIVPEEIDPDNGRPGMELWKILVLGALRLKVKYKI